jgi:chromosome segregation ATPase
LRYINADALEAAIWAEIEKVLTNPAFLRQALIMNVEETMERLPQLEAQAARLQEQITDAEKKERRALELALSLNDMSMDTLKGMVTEIQREKQGWQEERDRLTWRMAELTATADRLRDIDEQINAIIASVHAHMYDQD